MVIAQHEIPEDTNEITQLRQLLDPVGLDWEPIGSGELLGGSVRRGDSAGTPTLTWTYATYQRRCNSDDLVVVLDVAGSNPVAHPILYSR